MMKKVLPVGQPVVWTYKNYAIPLSIMANAPESRIWALNRFLQLYTRRDISEDYHWLQFYLIHDSMTDNYSHNPWLSIQTFDSAWIAGHQSVHSFIQARINQNQYVELNGDQYYLPHTYAYAKQHRFSNLLIHGYDDEEQAYHILDFTYTTTRQFQSLRIPYSDLILHIEGKPTKPLKIIQLNTDMHAEFNLELVRQLLDDYLHARSTPSRFMMLPQPFEHATFGTGVYAKLEEYIQALIAHTSYANVLPFHILYEHKKCVKELVEYLNQENMFRNASTADTILQEAASLWNKSQVFRNYKLKFLRNPDKALFHKMLDMLPDMKERDQLLCEAILSELRQET